jgi:hypothetical protein
MAAATQSFHNRIALAFDFDLTLAPGSFDAVIEHCGEDPQAWRSRHVEPLLQDGWEEILAKTYALAQMSRSPRGPRITRDLLAEAGRGLAPYEGVEAMFDVLRDKAAAVMDGTEVEFYLVSSGLLDVIDATSVAGRFKARWGTKLHFTDDDEISFPKLIVTHPEKVRYILAMCKGLAPVGANAPGHVYEDVAPEDWHLPLDQLIYVGDGSSDMPVFRLLNESGGLAIGVYKSETPADWPAMKEMTAARRVQNLAPADYRADGELLRSLTLAVESVAKKLALRRLGRGE